MPELPEVEIVRQSLNKKINKKKVEKVLVRNRNLRLKIPKNFEKFLKNQKIVNVKRFSKVRPLETIFPPIAKVNNTCGLHALNTFSLSFLLFNIKT